MHTQQRHRRSHRHDTQTGKRNDPPPTPPHAREVVRNHTDCKPIATATRVRQRDHTRQTLHRRVRARHTVATLQRHSRGARCTNRGTARLATTPTNPPPPPPPTHAKSCVIVRDGPHVRDVQPRTPGRSISDARSITSEAMRYVRNHVITQCHHGMHAMHSRTHTHACPCIYDARRSKPNVNHSDMHAITQSRD